MSGRMENLFRNEKRRIHVSDPTVLNNIYTCLPRTINKFSQKRPYYWWRKPDMIINIFWDFWVWKEDATRWLCVSSCVEVCAQLKNVNFTISHRSLQQNNIRHSVAPYWRLPFFSSPLLGRMLCEANAMIRYIISLLKKPLKSTHLIFCNNFLAFCVFYLLR